MIPLWQKRGSAAILLLPAALVFSLLVLLRRLLYRIGLLRAVRLPVPVIVVGNVTVGGAGKTPLVLWLAQALARHGRRPGIVSRGYGGAVGGVREVRADDPALLVGDEPSLLKARAGCPVFVGRDRVAAAQALLAAHPGCDVILSDDGLQHYRLARDFEVAVIDRRLAGNGWMLPAGPLREPAARLAAVDAVVKNGDVSAMVHGVPTYDMQLAGNRFESLDDASKTRAPDDFAGLRLHAVAGIGDPRRFFDHLVSLGLAFESHAFPDHHDYRAEDLAFSGDAILATEKDAVKLRGLPAPLPVWVLPVTAVVEPDLAEFILEKLDGPPPA